MKKIFLAMLAAIMLSSTSAAQPDGSDGRPFHSVHRKSRSVAQGRVDCSSSSGTLLASANFRSCASVSFVNASTDLVYLCLDIGTCATGAGDGKAGIVLSQYQSITVDWATNVAGDWTCISAGTSQVHYFVECGG